MLQKSALYEDDFSRLCQGSGSLDMTALYRQRVLNATTVTQRHYESDGSGSLEAARGTDHVFHEGVALEGEVDIMSNPWTGYCTTEGCIDTLWDGGSFNGTEWTGLSWSGLSWSGLSWSGLSWSGLSWSDASWSGISWSGLSWSGLSWSGLSWSGDVWHGLSWK